MADQYLTKTGLEQVWGKIKAFLNNKVDKVAGKELSSNDYTTEEKTKLAGIATGAQVNSVTGVKGSAESSYRTGDINLTAANVGAAASTHSHAISDTTGLQDALDEKADNAGILSEVSLFDLTPAVFQANQTEISINTGANLRTASILGNYMESFGHNLTGSTFRSLILTSGRAAGNPESSSYTLYKTDFKAVPTASDKKLLMTIRRFLVNNGTTTMPPQIFVASYDSNGKIWWAGFEASSLGYYRQRYVIDSKVLTNGNICVLVEFRRPTHTIQATFDLDVVAATSPVSAPGTSFATLMDSGLTAQEAS